jgi:hypothetical protein
VKGWQTGSVPWDGRTSLLSWVSRTATPASTLPTVSETSIVCAFCLRDALSSREIRCDNFLANGTRPRSTDVSSFYWQKHEAGELVRQGRFLWRLFIMFSQYVTILNKGLFFSE